MEKEEEEKTAVRTPNLNDEGKGRKKKEKGKPYQKPIVEIFPLTLAVSVKQTSAHFKEGKTSLKHSEI